MDKNEKKRSFVKVNEEELIEAIKSHKELYDCTDKNFKRHASRNAAWSKIAKQVGLTENEAKKRWRSLRDGFIKHVKQHDEETRGAMLHYDILKFLLPYVTGENARTRTPSAAKKSRNVVSNIIYIQNDTDELGTQYIRAMDDEVAVESNEDEEMEDGSLTNPKTETVEIIPTETDENTETYTIEEATETNVKFNHRTSASSGFNEQNLDSDERFLISLAPTLRRLDTKKNTLARIKIQQLLFELEFDEKV
ncbi:uncharacterized protein LOC134830162 [Culicoides brevitarsis]|uniref:uncharacterized protein LOC134830162 n=1 Tax=Culicoides brevitarsis TaxID=469753 RepID=UPI00307B7977